MLYFIRSYIIIGGRKMKTINSKSSNGLKWKVNNRTELSNEDISFIESFNPSVYHNDLTCKLWAYDEKLPSGKWLENISFNNSLTEAKALVL
jgi:hypothetical protein